jgi:hypothetical protein
MMQEAERPAKRARTSPIPLRPELVEFLEAEGLGNLSCVSAALRKDVLDSKAWTLMANAHLPRSAEEAALAAERAAAARLRSQVLRRRLADSMSRAPAPHRLAPNKLDDFAFFVRFEEDGRVLWEGEMAVMGFVLSEFSSRKFVELSMSEARSAIKASASFTDVPDDDDEYWHRVRFTLIAIRDEDQAMIPLGSFRFAEDRNDPTFYSPQALYQTEQNEILLELIVNADDGELNSLELSVELHDRTNAKAVRHERWLDDLTKRQVEYLLTYLAGAYDYRSRPHALATIGNWFNDARRGF